MQPSTRNGYIIFMAYACQGSSQSEAPRPSVHAVETLCFWTWCVQWLHARQVRRMQDKRLSTCVCVLPFSLLSDLCCFNYEILRILGYAPCAAFPTFRQRLPFDGEIALHEEAVNESWPMKNSCNQAQLQESLRGVPMCTSFLRLIKTVFSKNDAFAIMQRQPLSLAWLSIPLSLLCMPAVALLLVFADWVHSISFTTIREPQN